MPRRNGIGSALRRRTSIAVVTAAAAAATVVAGCGSDSDSSASKSSASSNGSSGTQTITIGTVPSASALPLLVADKTGMFKKAGLNVKVELIGTPSNSYPELIANKIQALVGTATTTVTFNANGAGVNIIAGYEVESTSADDDFFRVLSLKGSGINSIKDLVGKKVAIGQLKSLGDLTIMGALSKAGLDPDSVHFVAIPFPNQLAALKSHQVVAMWQGEPFATQSKAKADLTQVCACGYDALPQIPVGAISMTEKYEQANPEVVDKLQKVFPEAYKYVQTHDSEARSLLQDFLKVDAATAKNMTLPPYVDSFPMDSFHQLEQLMLKLGYVKKLPADSSVLKLG